MKEVSNVRVEHVYQKAESFAKALLGFTLFFGSTGPYRGWLEGKVGRCTNGTCTPESGNYILEDPMSL